VRVQATTVTAENPDAPSDYDEFALGSGLRVDDLLTPELDNVFPLGTRFRSVTGVLGQSFDHQKLWPRGVDDLALEGVDGATDPLESTETQRAANAASARPVSSFSLTSPRRTATTWPLRSSTTSVGKPSTLKARDASP